MMPNELAKSCLSSLRGCPEQLRLNGSKLVKISQKNHDGHGSKDGSRVLLNCSNLVALLVNSVKHCQTYHADFVNDDDGFAIPQRVGMRADITLWLVIDVNT